MFDGFYEGQEIYSIIRYIMPFTLILYFIIKKSAFKKSDLIFFIICLYLILLLVYSHGNFIISAKNLFALLIALLMIPVGRYLGSHGDFLEEFERYNRFLLIILPIYILYCNIMGIGESYSLAFTTGFLITSRMYIFSIVIFLSIHYLISNKNNNNIIKGIDIVLIIVNIGILIINTRRTAIGMLLMPLLVYTILNKKIIFRMVILILFLLTALIVSYPLYEEKLIAQVEERERILYLDSYEEEGRYVETIAIFDYYARNQKISEILFGIKLFDTRDFGYSYFGRDRAIHSDINMILYSMGVVGLTLFLLFFSHYFLKGNKNIIKKNKMVYYSFLVMFLIVLIPGRFIGTLSFAPLIMLILSAIKAQKSDLSISRSQNFIDPT